MEKDEAKIAIALIICGTFFMTVLMTMPSIPEPHKFLKIEIVKREAAAETVYFIRKRVGQ